MYNLDLYHNGKNWVLNGLSPTSQASFELNISDAEKELLTAAGVPIY